MGLDCYWVKPGETKSTPLDFDPPLCFESDLERRLWRGEGWAVFPGARGFENAVHDITGISLRALLTASVVVQVAQHLDAFATQLDAAAKDGLPVTHSRFRRSDGSPIPGDAWEYFASEVFRDIARMFRTYGEAGYELLGCW